MISQNVILLSALEFAAVKHKGQFRKGENKTPFINHPIKVANLLANEGKVTSNDVLIAAILHDVIEDTETTKEEIESLFGFKVCCLVMECTDNKNLPSWERKQNQVNYAPSASDEAKKIKLADKICNIIDIREDPPMGWSVERKLDYLLWANNVYEGLKGVSLSLDERFEAELQKTRDNLLAITME